MSDSSRRQFMLSAVRAALAAALPRPLATGFATRSPQDALQGPHLEFPTGPRDRLALTSWPFREFIDSPHNPYRNRQKPGMDVKEFAAMAAKEFGIHNICALAAHFHSTESEYLDAFRAAVQQAGSRIVDLGLGGGSFWDPDKSKRQAAVEYGQHWIDLAVQLGSPSIRQHLGAPRGVKPDVDLASGTLVLCLISSFTKSLDFVQDVGRRCCPDEGLGFLVVLL